MSLGAWRSRAPKPTSVDRLGLRPWRCRHRPVSCPWHWRSCGRSRRRRIAKRFPGVEYDNTHNESIVSLSSPAVAAALAVASLDQSAGRGSDCSRLPSATDLPVGWAASHRVSSMTGHHPTGLFATLVHRIFARNKLLRLNEVHGQRRRHSRQLCGRSAGMLGRWNTDEIPAASRMGSAEQDIPARSRPRRATGPGACVRRTALVCFASHLRDIPAIPPTWREYSETRDDRESRHSSFAPSLPRTLFIRISTRCCARGETHTIDVGNVESIDRPVAAFRESSPWRVRTDESKSSPPPPVSRAARVSLQYTLAEALYLEARKNAYDEEQPQRNPEILELARREIPRRSVIPGPGRFKGEVRVNLTGGQSLVAVEEYGTGSA